MNDRTRRFALTVIIALGLLLTLMLWSLCQGAVPLDWRDVAGALRLAPWPVSDITATIVTQLRLPRALLAALTGAALP